MSPIKIVDDDVFKYMKVVLRSLRRSTKLYVIKSFIDRRDNQQDKEVHKKEWGDQLTYDYAPC